MTPEFSVAIFVALIASVVGPTVLSVLNNRQAIAREIRANKRQDDVAAAVVEVARVAAASAASSEQHLTHIAATGDATHKIVNSQRTEMLRRFAVLTLRAHKDHPEDGDLARAARDAAEDLRVNEQENAAPVPVEVIVVGTKTTLPVDQIEKPTA